MLPIAAVIDAVSTGELFACGTGMPSLRPDQRDEKELVQVDLEELHIFRLQQACWAPRSIPFFPLQPDGVRDAHLKGLTPKDLAFQALLPPQEGTAA